MNIGYIINESISEPSEATIISETPNRVIAEGILQTGEEDNRNGRYYRTKDLQREITCPRTKELLAAGYLRAEAGHPMSKEITRQQTIDPANVIAQFLTLRMEGNNVVGTFKGTNNALGEFFDKDLRDGCKPAWSLRALGSISNQGGHAIVDNLRLIVYDHVIFPSHKSAYTTKIISESTNLSEDMEIREPGLLIPITNDSVISYIKSESCNLKTLMNNFDTLYESIEIINNGKDIQLQGKNGELFIVNLENYISNEIMDYCYNR